MRNFTSLASCRSPFCLLVISERLDFVRILKNKCVLCKHPRTNRVDTTFAWGITSRHRIPRWFLCNSRTPSRLWSRTFTVHGRGARKNFFRGNSARHLMASPHRLRTWTVKNYIVLFEWKVVWMNKNQKQTSKTSDAFFGPGNPLSCLARVRKREAVRMKRPQWAYLNSCASCISSCGKST